MTLQAAIDEFRADPANARFATTADVGGCWPACRAFARILARRGLPYTFRRYKNLPGERTEFQHVVEVDGLIIDWIGLQYRPGCEWPDVRSVAEFESEFGPRLWRAVCERCGDRMKGGRHRCAGPEADPTPAVEAEMGRLVRQFGAAQVEKMLRQMRGAT